MNNAQILTAELDDQELTFVGHSLGGGLAAASAYTMSTGIDNYEEYSYYIHSDYLGSTSYVTDATGAVSQHVEYVPFGEVFIEERNNTWNTPYLFNAKELDEETGLYYYGARYYDPRTSLWLSTDPLELKYPNISTYTYCANNPVNATDLNGDSISVLHIDGIVGHLALLIQNDNGKWNYFSVNGDNLYIGGIHFGGREFDDLSVGEFNSPNEFLYSYYNQKNSKSKDDRNFANYNYKSAYVIPTTPEQDQIIREEFVRISTQEEYKINPFNPNHCGTTVQRSLQKAGINIFIEKTNLSNGTFPGSSYKIRPYHPNEIYKTIKNNNPHGKEYKK